MHDKATYRPPGRRLGWFGLFGGITAWILHLAIGFALVYDGCQTGMDNLRLWLGGLTALLALIAAAAVWAAWSEGRSVRDAADSTLETVYGARHLMAVIGMLLSGLSLLIILTTAIAIIGLAPCQ